MHPVIRRLRERRQRHRARRRASRFAFALAGFVCLVGGLALLVLPGPGLVVIALGLGLLALEFDWAERWLERTLHHSERAARKARKAPLWQRVVVTLLLVAAASALVVGIALTDVPYFPG